MAILASGNCGNSLTWTLDDTLVLTIGGTGEMTDYTGGSNMPSWYDHRDSIAIVIIEDGVTSIGAYAFNACTKLTSITIPDSVTNIGFRAFNGCIRLTSISIPDNITIINIGLFYGCTELISITIPNNVTSIGNFAFDGCTNLKSVIIGENVTTIGDYVFRNCNNLIELRFMGDAPTTGTGCFPSSPNLTVFYYEDSAGWTLSDGKWNGYPAVEMIVESEIIITDSKYYKSIARAIRAKKGTDTKYKPSEMDAAIRSISTGSTGTILPTLTTPASASNVLSGKQFIDQSGNAVTGTMSSVSAATPSISVSTSGLITASSTQSAGYVAAGTKSATKQLTTQAGKTITPSTSSQTAVASGRYTTGAVTVAGDVNLVRENIKSGVSIFGVTGNYSGSGGGNSDSVMVYKLTNGDVNVPSRGLVIYAPDAFNDVIAFTVSFYDEDNMIGGTITLDPEDDQCYYFFTEFNNTITGNRRVDYDIEYSDDAVKIVVEDDVFGDAFGSSDFKAGFLIYE